jgi:hypothetical protein
MRKETSRNRGKAELSLHPSSGGILLGLPFSSEDEGDMFLRNIGLSDFKSNVTLHNSVTERQRNY